MLLLRLQDAGSSQLFQATDRDDSHTSKRRLLHTGDSPLQKLAHGAFDSWRFLQLRNEWDFSSVQSLTKSPFLYIQTERSEMSGQTLRKRRKCTVPASKCITNRLTLAHKFIFFTRLGQLTAIILLMP